MNKTVKMTLLVDNECSSELTGEHGFSAWIEVGDQRILFDTGQGMALEKNALSLGVDLSQATSLVISHGHYDHVGGVPDFLVHNAHAPVYYGRGALDRRYSCPPDQVPRAIGIQETVQRALGDLPGARSIELEEPRYLAPSIGISGSIPRLTTFEDTGGPFFLDEAREHPDKLDDELAIWFETASGLVILTGCCHSGLVNTVNHIRKVSGIDRVHGIIGGLHLLNASERRLEQTFQFIREIAPDFLIPCHCTGGHVVERLVQVFGTAMVWPGRAGQVHECGVLQERVG